MQFLNSAQEITYRKVQDYITSSELFKDQMQTDPEEPSFCLTYGSAKVDVDVLAWEVHPWETRELAIVRAVSQAECLPLHQTCSDLPRRGEAFAAKSLDRRTASQRKCFALQPPTCYIQT